jgi:hypothetical protein
VRGGVIPSFTTNEDLIMSYKEDIYRAYNDLALAIVIQAIDDYKDRKNEGKTVSHLVKFFKSDWCKSLLVNCSITGEVIADKLRNLEYPEFKKKHYQIWF